MVKLEVRERTEQCEKLKNKYELMVKSMGDKSSFDEKEIPSHAFHLVQLAQEKAELQEQGEILRRKVEKEERELIGLEQAMAMLKNSNGKYRETNFKRDATESEEVKSLKEKVVAKSTEIERLKNEIEGMEAVIKFKEVQLLQSETKLEQAQALFEEKSDELAHLQKETKDQDVKLIRAEKVRNNLRQSIKMNVPNIEVYEQDMDLRAEKERQRGALIKLRELSIADANFSVACQAEMERLRLTVPTLSRMEMRAVSSGGSRRSASASRLNTAEAAGFYRKRSVSSRGGVAPGSVLLMEMAGVNGNRNGGGRSIRAQLPVVN